MQSIDISVQRMQQNEAELKRSVVSETAIPIALREGKTPIGV